MGEFIFFLLGLEAFIHESIEKIADEQEKLDMPIEPIEIIKAKSVDDEMI